MNVNGKSISIEQAAEILGSSEISMDVTAGGMTAKGVKNSDGTTTVFVQGLGDTFLQLDICA